MNGGDPCGIVTNISFLCLSFTSSNDEYILAEVIVLGDSGISGLDQRLAARLGVPVIDAVAAAVVWAEALVQLSVQTSKALTYRAPEIKPIVGYPDFMQPTNLR